MVRLVPAATELLLMGHGSTLLSIGDGSMAVGPLWVGKAQVCAPESADLGSLVARCTS